MGLNRQADPAPFGITWRYPLAPYQIAGITRLASGSLILADDMGLGKTIQAIGGLRLRARAGGGPALVVVPASILLQWRAELRDWAPELRISTARGTQDERRAAWQAEADVYLAGYESLVADMLARYPRAPALREWDVVVLDEAQRLKNPRAATTLVLRRLHRKDAWALSGTPLENRLDDLVSILNFVAPGRFDRRSMMVGLRGLLARMLLRRRRSEVMPELPTKTRFHIALPLLASQRSAYDIAEREGIVWLRSMGDNIRVSHVLELILRLKQICNAHPETGASAKLDDLARRVDDITATGEKALVFSQFVSEPFGVMEVAHRLRGLRPLTLTGRQDVAERARVLGEFAADPARRVLVLSLRAGGVGLNLTAASVVFLLDHWWTPSAGAQAEDRAHRKGQLLPVQVFSYLTPDTIETRIAEIIARKQGLFDAFVDGVDMPGLARLELSDLLEAVGV